MKIQLLFFGISTDIVGKKSMSFMLKNNASVKDLKEALIGEFSGLKNLNQFAVAVNEEYANDDFKLKSEDVIAIIPPVSGG